MSYSIPCRISAYDPTAPWNLPSNDDHDEYFKCANCGIFAWQLDGETRIFESGTYRDLPDAHILPNGQFACSVDCASQLMFEAALPDTKEMLLQLEHAVRFVSEFGRSCEIVDAWLQHQANIPALVEAADKVRSALGIQPDWILRNEHHPLCNRYGRDPLDCTFPPHCNCDKFENRLPGGAQ